MKNAKSASEVQPSPVLKTLLVSRSSKGSFGDPLNLIKHTNVYQQMLAWNLSLKMEPNAPIYTLGFDVENVYLLSPTAQTITARDVPANCRWHSH
jgi:hypothetical protein